MFDSLFFINGMAFAKLSSLKFKFLVKNKKRRKNEQTFQKFKHWGNTFCFFKVLCKMFFPFKRLNSSKKDWIEFIDSQKKNNVQPVDGKKMNAVEFPSG